MPSLFYFLHHLHIFYFTFRQKHGTLIDIHFDQEDCYETPTVFF